MPRVLSLTALTVVLLSSMACDRGGQNPQPLGPSPLNLGAAPADREQLTGLEVVARVAAQYPERLEAGVSLEQRVANMEFLRDRVIELGNCSGLLLARNRKQNGHLSTDAINWRHGEQDINDVVDLALSYDDTGRSLQLHWLIVDGPAGWGPIPSTCR